MPKDPIAARKQATEILRQSPGLPQARLLLAMALRLEGALAASLRVLDDLGQEHPQSPGAKHERALTLQSLGRLLEAAAEMRRVVQDAPNRTGAWLLLADLLSCLGERNEAQEAYAGHLIHSAADEVLVAAANAMADSRLDVAETILRQRLDEAPTDLSALRMLAEIGTRLGRFEDAESILSRCLGLLPDFHEARYNLALVLFRQNRLLEALTEARRVVEGRPQDPASANLLAATLASTGSYEEAIGIYERLLDQEAQSSKLLLSYGHALKTVGRRDDCVSAYRRAITVEPGFGEAYWSLANLKSRALDDGDVISMTKQIAHGFNSDDDRLHLHYALGKALEDRGEWDHAFRNYAEGARIRRAQIRYSATETTAQVNRSIATFDQALLRRTRDAGCQSPDPIFIVGLPRAGSTLVEQILASHSLVEGTMELPELAAIARGLNDEAIVYPQGLRDISSSMLDELGCQYIDRTKHYRKTDRPFFIDKMPNNWVHVGLILTALPNAKIIDARRHPMASCFSAFKQHFAKGQHFSYDLADLGEYYKDYARLMTHFDEIAADRVIRVIYEDVVESPENAIANLLERCGLTFEEDCINFHRNARPVRTASSEQVRRPIFQEGLEHWRHFDEHLGPLRDSLGSVLQAWRGSSMQGASS